MYAFTDLTRNIQQHESGAQGNPVIVSLISPWEFCKMCSLKGLATRWWISRQDSPYIS